MKDLSGVKIRYIHPAVPPKNIYLNWIYTIGMDEKGVYLDDGNLIQYMDLNLIKILFIPLGNNNWYELLSDKIIE